jgi:hypothetical protein
MANKNNLPKPSVDPKTGEIKNANFNSSIWDAYNTQSEEQLKEMEGMKGSPYAGLDYSGMEETEDAVPIVQKLNYRFDPSSFTFKAYDQDGEHVERTFMEKVKDNKTPIIQGGLSIANSVLGRNEMMRNDRDRESQIQDIYGTDPIWDYNEMYGNNTNGGSQFQPIIKAEKGAKVRNMLNTATPIEIEGGEFLVLPDGTTELAKGPKHKDGGINTILPEGSIVYSNKLKPEGSKKTFAQLAKDNDTSSYVKTLKDPFSDTIARNSAERMLQRKQQKLTELFQQQQMMNGNSSGEPMMKNGGYTEYEDGGTFDFVRNQSPNPTTNFEKRMYNNTNKIQNEDDTQSTHKMMSWSDDNGFYAAPTIVEKNGKLIQLSEEEAQEYAYKTGELKQFKTDKEAQEYARNGYKKGTPMEIFSPNEEYRGFENGEKIKTIMENGGIVEGQELELTKEEIKFLKKQGFKFDIL